MDDGQTKTAGTRQLRGSMGETASQMNIDTMDSLHDVHVVALCIPDVPDEQVT